MKKNSEHSYLFLIDMLETGGIQRQMLEVCKAVISKGGKCAVASFRNDRDEMSGIYKSAGVEVLFLNKKSKFDFAFLKRLRKLLKENSYSLIHAMTPQTAFWASLVLPFDSSSRFVNSLLNVYKYNKISERICESLFVAPRLDAVFINSAAGVKQYKEKVFSAPEIWHVYNGVNLDINSDRNEQRKALGIADDEFAIICVGRLEPVKRHIDAIEAMIKISRASANIKLYIAGDGKLRDFLTESTNNFGVKDRVVFLGLRNEIEKILPAFDIFLLPSKSEGFPNVLLEAMAASLPCIASAVGGIPEIIKHNENGILIKPQSPEEISKVVIELYKNQKIRNHISSEARKTVERDFSMTKMTENMISHYENLIESKQYDIAYILSLFPMLSETFILREIVEMNNRGLKCSVVSLKPPYEKVVQDEAKKLSKSAIYLPWFGISVLLYNIYYFVKHPFNYIKCFAHFLLLHKQYKDQVLKAFIVWWKTVGFAFKFRKYGIKHVHANWATIPTACAMIISKLNKCTFSFTAHAHDIYGLPTSLPEKIKSAGFISTCTARNVKHLNDITNGKYKDKINLVRHFLKPPENIVSSPSVNPLVILSIGSLEAYKGHDILIRAFAEVLKTHNNTELRIIGGGPEKDNLQSLIDSLNLTNKVKLIGRLPQEEVFKELSKSTVFALASIHKKRGEDNLPNVLVEASLIKVPCVVSDLGSISEFIENGKSGFLITPGNKKQLSDKILNLLENESLRTEFAEKSRIKAIEMFDIKKNASLLEKLFREVVDK